MRTINYFWLAALLVTAVTTSAQTNLDSLYAVWQDGTLPDSTRASTFNMYIWKGFLYSDPDSAAILADELIAFGHEQAYSKALASAYTTKGVSYLVRGDYPQALDYYNRSLKLKEQDGDQVGIAATLNRAHLKNIGGIEA